MAQLLALPALVSEISAALRIGEIIVSAALTALGIKKIGAIFNSQLVDNVKGWIKNRGISSYIKEHALKSKHKFNSKCGEQCILQVANKVKINESLYADNDIPYIKGTGNCEHGCLIEVRMSIPPNKTEWEVGTAFHIGPCKAI